MSTLIMLRSVYTKCVKALASSLLVVSSAAAHNNVVVIPMAGDDIEVPAELTPTTPIANVDTNQNDYTISALAVIDKITGLEWQRLEDDVARDWDDAWNYCSSLDLDGHQDWRLPSVKELQSIFDSGQVTSSAIDRVAFPNTDANFYWSATPDASNSSQAWLVFFGFNSVNILDAGKSANNLFVRCVR